MSSPVSTGAVPLSTPAEPASAQLVAPGVPRLVKGHGTQNDFVLFADADAQLDLGPEAVAAVCDRRAGIGADGLIRAVPTRLAPAVAHLADRAEWFMDYRNGDGSLAEMCGNGVRVFVAFLVREGLIDLALGEQVSVATRAGVKTVRLVPAEDESNEWFAVGMGPWALMTGESGLAAGHDALVHLPHLGVALPGLRVDVGNPHVVVALPEDVELEAIDLTSAPAVDPVAPDGINVELVRVREVSAVGGHLQMRVHERGSGETRSCGTGAVATVLAARAWLGAGAPTVWRVDVPGGRLRVTLGGDELAGGVDVELAGPAVLLGDVLPSPGWWAALPK